MHALLIALGSSGDVHPFVGLGRALAARGHRVTVVTNPHFEPLVRRAGLDFLPIGTEEELYACMENPDLWSPTKGFKVVIGALMGPIMRPLYDLVVEQIGKGDTVVVGPATALGARLAQETHGARLATVHLQPLLLRSLYESGRYAANPLVGRGPRWFKRMCSWLIDQMVDRTMGPRLNALRAELGLAPVRGIMNLYWHSTDLIICLFPDWFAPPQPDWPPNTILTGFPLWDETGVTEAPEGLEEFLTAGSPPIVFTPGSAMLHGHDFFRAAVDACVQLGRRGILLTRYPEQIPQDLPASVRHFDFVPLSQLLPRSAALVSHGGIGTVAQALASGVPQLIMPMSHDQPDNAYRLAKLGVGDSLSPARFRGTAVARKLVRLLSSKETATRCRELAARFDTSAALNATCAAIEGLAKLRAGVVAPAES